MYKNLVPRFLKYVKVNTRSDEASTTVPSTQNQVDFAKQVLIPDLEELGLKEIFYNDSNGFVTAALPANTEKSFPVIGFIAHMDTADFASEHVNPQIVENYQGDTIILDKEKNVSLSPADFPNLNNYIGQTLITTDGKTLLGSDDKAGIVEILTAIEILSNDNSIEHGTIKIAFGPDEEIGRGADLFDVEAFGCDFAYTMDGGPVGELEYESFNAAQAVVEIQGKNVHPGSAKNTMVNALKLAFAFDKFVPADEVPEKTEGREGFYHLATIEGTVDAAKLVYIIRDHDRKNFEARKEVLTSIADTLNHDLNEKRITVKLEDQYYNMREILEKDMRPVELAKTAMENIGIEPVIEPIRGGTDGSKLSFMGLPTPNIFAGGENMHGRYEYVAVESMQKAADVIVEIVKQSRKYHELS